MDRKQFSALLGAKADIELQIRKKAAQVHADVNQHYDEHPYFYHLNKVACHVIEYLPDIIECEDDILPVLFGAYFHDSIEDARLTYNDVKKIAREYMTEAQAYMAAEIVYALTNEKGRNRHERANDKYYEGIRNTKYASLVKACDRLSNYEFAKATKSRMVKMYESEMDEFINHIDITKYVTEWHPSLTPGYYLTEDVIAALKNTV